MADGGLAGGHEELVAQTTRTGVCSATDHTLSVCKVLMDDWKQSFIQALHDCLCHANFVCSQKDMYLLQLTVCDLSWGVTKC